jgi:hypothetical protein
MANYWVLGIYDRATNNPYVLNIPLLPGYDLLQQFGYMGIGSCALSNIGDKTILVPNISNLGTDFALFWKYDD